MIINNLTLNNFRVFQGEHSFDLTPKVKHKKKHPIILFGGLNGAGKTTILIAIRLVLYGKQSLGYGVTNKIYHGVLASLIHNAKDEVLQPYSSDITLTFQHTNMGRTDQYTVKRSWMINGKKLIENLEISKNGKSLPELNSDQCQGFLNELIPIGVSELFFFDGEKIANLAEDTGGVVLGDAIKKLLGLDLLETLNADLTVLLRNKAKKNASQKLKKQIIELETILSELEANAEKERQCYEQIRPAEAEVLVRVQQLENELSSRGGAWAETREECYKQQQKLIVQKETIETQLRDLISDTYPISIAADFAKSTLKQLKQEQKIKNIKNTSVVVGKHIISLQKKLSSLLGNSEYQDEINQIIQREFKTITHPNIDVELVHDVSESTLNDIEVVINNVISTQRNKFIKYQKALAKVKKELNQINQNIARAPEEAQIKPIIDELTIEQNKRIEYAKIQALHLEEYKRLLKSAIDVTRKLDRLSESLDIESEKDRTAYYANHSKLLISQFRNALAKKKVKNLESELIKSFQRLSRKDDMKFTIKINPANFSVTLIDDHSNELDKNELSAGEKQIYAISILEALAKISGKKLPIIIDTPLGRLDSVHRTNLIKNYFPNASHQVIILSTDTEVDEEFYTELSNSISHAYRLEYSEKSGSTSVSEGYFWKSSLKGVNSHAA